MESLFPINYNNKTIRTINKKGDVWFVAKDVCEVLEISNYRDAVEKLDDDEKGVGVSDTLGGEQSMIIISESGLYSLIFRSNKPEARVFRKWVTAEVLPAIRKTGKYYSQTKILELVDKAIEDIDDLQNYLSAIYGIKRRSQVMKIINSFSPEIALLEEIQNSGRQYAITGK